MKPRHAVRLTEAQVIDIYGKFHYFNVTLRALSREYDVDSSTIGRIVRGESHKHVARPNEPEWVATHEK